MVGNSFCYYYADELCQMLTEAYPEKEVNVYNVYYESCKLNQQLCTELAEKDNGYTLTMVNSGTAWTKARQANETENLIPQGGLCARLTKNNGTGDKYHDGDIGGGQYLNACVWYETLTGKNCLDNSYKPTTENGKYELSDDFADLLRTAAHG